MTNSLDTDSPSPSSSPPSSVTPSPHWLASLTSSAVRLMIAWKIGATLPALATDKSWERFGAALVALVVVAVPPIAGPLLQATVGRFLPGAAK